MELNTDAKPLFNKQRAMPFTLKVSVKEELNKLEVIGVIKKKWFMSAEVFFTFDIKVEWLKKL